MDEWYGLDGFAPRCIELSVEQECMDDIDEM